MQPENEEDRALCARAAAGDESAFAALVARHERPLRSFLARMGAGSEADDLAQEAFVRAWRFAGQYDGRARFATWLTRIAWRCWMDQLRKRRPEPVEERQAADPAAGSEIADLLARLPGPERAALILCEGHGWSHAEAAAMLDMPLGSLKSRVARAKERCRQMWEHSHDR